MNADTRTRLTQVQSRLDALICADTAKFMALTTEEAGRWGDVGCHLQDMTWMRDVLGDVLAEPKAQQ